MPATEPRPISLSDDQLIFLTDLVQPLPPPDRSQFLQLLAADLGHEQQPIGDGVFHRKASALFARFFRPPVLSAPQPARYERSSRLKAQRRSRDSGSRRPSFLGNVIFDFSRLKQRCGPEFRRRCGDGTLSERFGKALERCPKSPPILEAIFETENCLGFSRKFLMLNPSIQHTVRWRRVDSRGSGLAPEAPFDRYESIPRRA